MRGPPPKRSAFVSGLFLAAGLSSRYGSQKLLLKLPGGSVAECSLRNLLESAVDEVIIVTGVDAALVQVLRDIAEARYKKNITFIENPSPERGMASSARIAVDACGEESEGFLFLLADLPFVVPFYIDRAVAEFRTDTAKNIIPIYGDKQGHPVIISSRWRGEFSSDRKDYGGRKIINRHFEETKRIEFRSDLPLLDIDTEEDYREAVRRWGTRSTMHPDLA